MKTKKYIFRNDLRDRISTRALLLGLLGGLAMAPAAVAQSVPTTSAQSSINLDLGAVLASGTATNNGDASIPGTAANEAPTRASLKETQPTSVISQKFIQNNMTPLVNYTDIMNLSPSASSTDEEGPGLTESHHTEMRGFQDGFYNVTFDGIPYGDSNDFTHHSTTFFAANDVGEEIIDRGPGTASTEGDATFGGTVAIISKDPLSTTTLTPYGTYGTWHTYLGGTEFDTGVLPTGATAFVDGAYSGSDTYNSNAKLARSNVFTKGVQPLGSNFVLTAVAMYNDTYQQYASGATAAELAAFGYNYGLSNNPLSQNYFGYNTDHYKTDFEYIDLRGTFGDGWTVDSKLYTYAYYHHSLNGVDTLDCPEQGFEGCSLAVENTDSLTTLGKKGAAYTGTDTLVPGQFKFNTYRSFGTITRLQKDFDVDGIGGDVKAGVWYDHQSNTRALIDENLVTGQNLSPVKGDAEPIERLMHDSLDTFQPYFQIDIKPDFLPGLTLSPGVKWDYFKRGIDAAVNQKTYLPLGYIAVYEKPLPSVEANYAINPEVSAYAQWAEGYLAPNLNALYSIPANLNQSTLQPQVSNNYQTGVVVQTPSFAGDADVYYIPFSNLADSTKVNGYSVFFNGGGALYKGVEAEGTYALGNGFDIYANGSINSANYNGSKGKNHVAETPQATWAAGLLFDNGTYNGSIIDKWTGGKYGADTPDQYWFDPYNIINLSAGVDLPRAVYGAPPVKLTFNVDNATDQREIYDYAGTTTGLVNAPSQVEYYTLPGASYFVNVSVPLTF